MSGDERVRHGVEGEAELVKYAERNSDDGFAGGELEEFPSVTGEDFNAAATPFDSFDGAGELDAGASFTYFSGEEVGEAIVAFANAEEVLAVNLFFSVLLNGERMDADLAIVGSIESLDVADDLFALFRR